MTKEINQDLLQAMFLLNTNLPEFSGRVDEDPLRWLSEFEKKTFLLSEEKKLQTVKHCFEETPKFWYEAKVLPKLTSLTWSEFKETFIKEFFDEEKRDVANNKLRTMRYEIGEVKINSFIIDFIHWFEVTNPSAIDKQKISEIIGRLPSNFQSRLATVVKTSDIKDIDELRNYCERIEKSFLIEKRNQTDCFSASTKKFNME